MNKLKDNIRRFMAGRYGPDQLGRFLLIAVIVLVVLNLFLHSDIIYMFSLACIILCYFRICSKKIDKRYKENQIFLRFYYRAAQAWNRKKFQLKQAKDYHIYNCPGCGQKIRIPRGKGKISIHCPKCNIDFIKKS